MDKQAVKMKTLGAIFLISLLSFGCGSAGSGGNAGDGSPTLGITSIQKGVGGTPKPNLALNLMNKGLGFLFGTPVIAQTACSPADSAITIPMNDGTIYITQAYAILDEVEFGLPTSVIHIQTGPFALDLTNRDPDVPEMVTLSTIPRNNYTFAKFKIGRLDATDLPPINLVGDPLSSFISTLFDVIQGGVERRPSIWIEGFMQLDTPGSLCEPFIFFTDKDQKPVPPINFVGTGSIDPSQLDVILFLDIEQAFADALGLSATPVQDFIGEIGSMPFEGDFLDGRTFNEGKMGTPNAVKLANELFRVLNVFSQPAGSFTGTMEDDAFQESPL